MMKNILKNLKSFIRLRLNYTKRFFLKPKLPINKDGKVLLHLGCGEINSPEYVNIDTRPFSHVHCISDITDLSEFCDNSADLIYACMVLEHISRTKLLEVLIEWRRVLKKKGILRLTVPDFDKIVDCYHKNHSNIEVIAPALMGGQGYESNFHFSVFNKEYLSRLLKEAGFKEVFEWDPQKAQYHNFSDWANKKLAIGEDGVSVSLNLEAVK